MTDRQILELITKINKQYQNILIKYKSISAGNEEMEAELKVVSEESKSFICGLHHFDLIAEEQYKRLFEFNVEQLEFASYFLQ